MKFTYANIVTLSRFFMAPIFLIFMLSDSPAGTIIALIVFVLAALSDWLDGYLARKYGEVTDHGVFLDPLADKVLTTSAFVALYMLNIMDMWMLVVIVLRDFATTAMRSIADDRGMTMQTSKVAKVKTFLQMVVIIIAVLCLAIHRAAPVNSQLWGYASFVLVYGWITAGLLLVTALSIYSLFQYIIVNRRLFSRGST
ncbi:MAG: CDP-diacylglycerol--glycerol-3-phosphate 3-phosphatidyltransferase [Candidatus Kapabacteria bacterium]|nr:CDP-diacylglycerol--glycerol-3-phosphate 3-phosphatidyltransferase [Candidatus Kapabacteria bacterium]